MEFSNKMERKSVTRSTTPYLHSPDKGVKHRRKLTLRQSMFNIELEPSTRVQSRSSSRLHRGQTARKDLSQVSQDLSVQEVKAFEVHLRSREQQDLSDFIRQLTAMKPLTEELHLLKEAADSKVHQRQVDPLGQFYQLLEELSVKYTDEDLSSLLTSEMKRLTSKLREFMHNLTSVGQGDQGVLLEIFWRQVVKLVDFSLGLHEITLFKKMSAVQTSLSSEISAQRRRMTLQGDSVLKDNIKLRSEVATLQDQVKALSSKLEEVKQENYELVREKISVETGYSRAAQLTSMSELLWKIDRYISESEAEHAKLADIMVGLHEVIKASKHESGEKSFIDKATQTLWTVKQSPLPMRHTPLVSDHEFYDLFHLEGLQPNSFIGLDSLEQVLRSANTARDFNFNLTVQLLRKHTKLELISASLIEVFKQVKPNSSREWVFHQLMFLERPLPVEALKYIQTLLLQLDSLGPHDLVAFSELEGLVTQIFSQDLQATAEVFSSLEATDITLPECLRTYRFLCRRELRQKLSPTFSSCGFD